MTQILYSRRFLSPGLWGMDSSFHTVSWERKTGQMQYTSKKQFTFLASVKWRWTGLTSCRYTSACKQKASQKRHRDLKMSCLNCAYTFYKCKSCKHLFPETGKSNYFNWWHSFMEVMRFKLLPCLVPSKNFNQNFLYLRTGSQATRLLDVLGMTV